MPMGLRVFPVVYATDVEREAQFWERLGFQRHVELPGEDGPGYVGLRRHESDAELAVTHEQWAVERYGLSVGAGPRFEMYVYVADLDGLVSRLEDAAVPILRAPQDMPWGERIATVTDPEGNPVALCQQT